MPGHKNQLEQKKKLRILCIADHVDPLVYSTHAKDHFSNIDLVLSAGDLNMSYLGFVASMFNRPLLFVFGNHNLSHLDQFRKRPGVVKNWDDTDSLSAHSFGSTYVGDKVIKTKGLLIAGLGGSIRYNDGRNQFTETEMLFKVMKLIPRLMLNKMIYGRYLDILLTHSPPRNLGDREDIAHRGFKAFRWFIEQFEPRYLLHGHVHLYDQNAPRCQRYHKTEIINVYDHYVLEVNVDAHPEDGGQSDE